MKRHRSYNKKYLAAAGLIGFGLVFFYLSAVAWGSFVWTKDSVMFYLEQPLSGREALTAAEQNQKAEELGQREEKTGEALDFCFWGEKKNVILSNENLSAAAQADAVFLCGKPELLFEECPLPVFGDGQGCLIDEETAWKLFGDTQVTGKEISYEGENYVIRGVIKNSERMAVFQVSQGSSSHAKAGKSMGEAQKDGNSSKADGGGFSEGGQTDGGRQESLEEGLLNRLTVQKPAHLSIGDLQSAWENQYNLSIKILDTELLRGLGGFCVLLFPATICFFFCVYLHHQYKEQEVIQKKAVTAGLALLMVILLTVLLKKWVQIPDDYIPTRWSDFSFWTELWEKKQEGARQLIRMSKSSLDDRWMNYFFQTAGYGLLAEVCLVTGMILLKYGGKFLPENKGAVSRFFHNFAYKK